MDFLTEPAVRRDPVEVRHQLHAEVDFRIDRRPTLPVGVAGRRQFSDELDRSRTRSIRRRKWSSATNDSKSMLAFAFGSNACTPCMAASVLENGTVFERQRLQETQFTAKNQAESELAKVLFFNRPGGFLELSKTRVTYGSMRQRSWKSSRIRSHIFDRTKMTRGLFTSTFTSMQ